MKNLPLWRFLFLACLPAAVSHAEMAAAPPMRDSVTAEELLAQVAKKKEPTAVLKPVELAVDPSVANRPGDLLERSDILCFGGAATLVPKRAIMNMPKNLSSRIGFQQGSKIQSWSDFYAVNRGWISTVEVSRAQAEGRDPLPEEKEKSIAKSPYIIVATYCGGPISVLPKKTPPPPAAGAPQKP